MRKLIKKLAKAEQAFTGTQFLAPRVLGNEIRVKIQGLVKTLTVQPRDFEGWGIFEAKDSTTVSVVQKATLPQVCEYLKLFKSVKLLLVRPIQNRTWLAYPANAGSFQERFGPCKPVLVHLVTLGRAFEQVIARWDGSDFWFETVDRRSNSRVPKRLASALKNFVAPDSLKYSGLTPEIRAAYKLIFGNADKMRVRCSEERLRQALRRAGGELESFADAGDFWTTHWLTSDGESHTSAIAKRDLTVLSAGICLDGEDQIFDLQSLVGVVEQRDEF